MANNRAEDHFQGHSAANVDTDYTSRLPVEVLSSIFELAIEYRKHEHGMIPRTHLSMARWLEQDRCEMETPGFAAAKVLSHVCLRWRLITVDMDSLWTDLTLSLTWDRGTFDHFRSTIFPRVKSAPCRLIIVDVDFYTPPVYEQTSAQGLPGVGSKEDILPLTSCILPSKMVISELDVIFLHPPGEYDHPAFLDYLASIKNGVTGINIDARNPKNPESIIEVARSTAAPCLGTLTGVLPQLRRVKIRRLALNSLLLGESCAALEELTLEVHFCNVDLSDLLAKLPNLIMLSLITPTLSLQDGPPSFNDAKRVYPKIRELRVNCVDILGWNFSGRNGSPKHFPSLRSLVLDNSSAPNGCVVEFLQKHTQIKRLVVNGVDYASVDDYVTYL